MEEVKKHWWTYKKGDEELVGSMRNYIVELKDREEPGQRKAFACSLLYGDVPYSKANSLQFVQNDISKQIAYNLCQMMTDTVVSRLTKSKPKPYFLTSGGSFSQKRRAKWLNKFIDGVFAECDAYEVGAIALRDACVTGDGLVHIYIEDDKVKLERVVRSELLVDEIETTFGEPRQMHRIKVVPKDCLAARYPKKQDEIDESIYEETSNVSTLDTTSMVEVIESWKLPSKPGAKDGRHLISIPEAILVDESWDNDFFPIVRLSWSPQLSGYWAQGLIEQLMPLQSEMNMLLWMISKSIRRGGTFKVFLPHGSQISEQSLSGDIGQIIKGSAEPKYLTPPLVQPEVYQQVQDVERRAFARAGLNEMSTQGKPPAGVESGVALRTLSVERDGRFLTQSRRYDKLFVDIADVIIALISDMPSYEVKVKRGQFLETIDWSNVAADKDEYTLQVFSINSLMKDPVGRLSQVAEFMDRGFLSGTAARRLMDFPDTEQVEDLGTAAEEWITKCMEDIVDHGRDDVLPDTTDDLKLAERYALDTLAQAKTSEADDDTIARLMTYYQQVKQLQVNAMMAQQQMQMAAQPPMASGMEQQGQPQPGEMMQGQPEDLSGSLT